MERIEGQDLSKLSLCRHCANQSSGFSRFLERIRSWSSSNSGLRCQECIEEMDMSPKEKKEVIFSAKCLWVCLDCDQIFCGAECCGQPDGHISYHAINNHHQFAIQIAAWCFDCKSLKWITKENKNEIKELNSAIKDKGDSRRIEPVDFDDLPSGYIVSPMHNLGNSCFFNAILQNLLSMNALRSILADLDCPNESITDKLWCLFLDTAHFPGEDEVIDSHCELFASICSRAPNFEGHQQQDSHELLRYLFNEILAEGNSFIEDIFGGKISCTVSCVQCGNTSQSYEPFLDISLAIPSNECSTKKDEVVAFEDNLLPSLEESGWMENRFAQSYAAKCFGKSFDAEISSCSYKSEILAGLADAEISGCPSKGDELYPSAEAVPTGESLVLSYQLSTVCSANWCTKHHHFPIKKVSVKVDNEDPNVAITISDTKESFGEDVNTTVILPLRKRISPILIPKVAESLESQQKDPIAEVEDVPDDGCGQHPCIRNKDLGGVTEFIENQQRSTTRKGGEDQVAEVEGLGRSYGHQSFICDSDSSEIAKLPQSQQPLLSEEEDSVEFQDVPKAVSCPVDKLSPLNDDLDSDDNSLSTKLKICSRKMPRCALSFKCKDGIASYNKNSDPLSIEKCLDLFTAPETLSCEYACDHCSNHSHDHLQTELPSTSKDEKFMESIQLGGHEIMDGLKAQDESKDEGMDIGSRKAKMEACKTYLFFKVPCILTIHLKRFTQDTNDVSKKINSHVNIQEMLDLTPYVDPSSEDKQKSGYRLVGVVEHVGENLTGGHYVAYVKGVHRQRKVLAWFRASDLDVREVSLKEVLDSNAYILFYERI